MFQNRKTRVVVRVELPLHVASLLEAEANAENRAVQALHVEAGVRWRPDRLAVCQNRAAVRIIRQYFDRKYLDGEKL